MADDFRELLKRKDADAPIVAPAVLFHATPQSRLASILAMGLEPRAENAQDHYEPRIYLTETEDRAVKMAFELRKAMVHRNVVPRTWKEDWVVLAVTPPSRHSFWIDGYSQGGVYTAHAIPADRIRVALQIKGENLLASKWGAFWNEYFWKQPSVSRQPTKASCGM